MRNIRFAIVSGSKNGDEFYCALEFNFNPLTCTRAAPKVEALFIGKSLEACQRIAFENGIDFKVLPPAKEGKPHPGAKYV